MFVFVKRLPYLCIVDKETYEKQKAFAGEKIPSMNRRMIDHDYQERQMYMVTMVTEGRRPLFGRVAGRSDGAPGTPDEPHVEADGFRRIGMTSECAIRKSASLHRR